jgi:NAD+ synthase (glutamine-hydrolysing)
MGLYGYPEERLGGLVQENIQARVRGHMLSTFAAVEGGVIMNNGNKIEAALGYATLYGDAVGAIAPIGDVTKVRLSNISRIINRRLGVEAVPMNLVPEETEDGYNWETVPSAELKDAQRDPMKWFYHDWLVERLLDEEGFGIEDLMEGYLNDRLQSSVVAKWVHFYGLDDPQAFIEDIEWVLKQMAGSAFKRVQMPPTIMVVRNAYGYENRENQVRFERTARYEDLKRRILSMG